MAPASAISRYCIRQYTRESDNNEPCVPLFMLASSLQHIRLWTAAHCACRDELQHTMGIVYERSQVQATRLGRNLQDGFGYVQDGVASGAST